MKHTFLSGENNIAKRADIREKIRLSKLKGWTFICIVCGKMNPCAPSDILKYNKKYCSRDCKAVMLMSGENAIHWKGGKTTDRNGYILIASPHHPFRTKSGYVREHRLVMEAVVGRWLKKEEDVHHINGIKTDNRIENLMLLTHSEHLKIHSKSRLRGVHGEFL